MRPRIDRSRSFRRLLWTGALIALSAAASHADCRGKKNTIDVSVTLDWEAKAIVVDPESVEVYLFETGDRPGRVCWTVAGLQEGQILYIGGKEGEPDRFPNRERKLKFPKEAASSGRPSMSGTWRYQLWVMKGDEELLRKDPEVVIRPNR